MKFDLDQMTYKYEQESEKNKDLISEINNINSHLKDIEAKH